MQHYRVPTRLLDWTESPLVALYFAVERCSPNDGALWMLNPLELNRVSRISPDYDRYVPSFDDDTVSNYLPSVLRAEYTTRRDPIAVIGPRNTSRMQAQLGVFTIIHRDATPVECVGDKNHIRKFRIPANAKCEIRKELHLLAVTQFQLFPDLQGLGDFLGGNRNV